MRLICTRPSGTHTHTPRLVYMLLCGTLRSRIFPNISASSSGTLGEAAALHAAGHDLISAKARETRTAEFNSRVARVALGLLPVRLTVWKGYEYE